MISSKNIPKARFIWLVVWTPLKNMNVNWDDEIPNIWENQIDVPNHEPVMELYPNHQSKTVDMEFSCFPEMEENPQSSSILDSDFPL